MPLDYPSLLEPISAAAPCGVDLDGIGGLAVFDAMRIFGQQLKPLGDLVPPTDLENEGGQTTVRRYRWREVLDEAAASLASSKDIRVLAHAGAAAVRVEGMESFTRTLEVAAGWLDIYWESVYPRVDSDADARSNALFSFADKMAILDAVRRVPLAVHKQLGPCSFRDVEQSRKAAQSAGNTPASVDPGPILEAAPAEHLIALENVLSRALAAVGAIEARMREKTANAAVPNLSRLSELLENIKTAVAKYLDPRRADAQAAADATTQATAQTTVTALPAANDGTPLTVGSIRSRQDAVRALDAVAEFFRKNEPSSPVPLFVERCKRLISMNFLELLADVAPTAVEQAKAAAGLRNDSK
jgi:type VI secretion system protein ImpA